MLAVKGNSSSKPDFPKKTTNIYYLQYRFGVTKIKYKFFKSYILCRFTQNFYKHKLKFTPYINQFKFYKVFIFDLANT